MKFLLFTLSVLLALCCVACYTPHNHWKAAEIHPAELAVHRENTVLTFNLALKQRNLDKLKQFVAETSNPEHISYQEWMNIEQLTQLIAPEASNYKSIMNYLSQSESILSIHEVLTKDFLTIKMFWKHAETFFQTKFHVFQHKASSRTIIRASEDFLIPAEIEREIDLITGLYDFFDHPKERKQLKALITAERERNVLRHSNDVSVSPADATNCGSNGPQVLTPRGSEKDISINVLIYCQNGQLTMNPVQPCSDQPPLLNAVELSLTFQHPVNPPKLIAWDINDLFCSGGSGVAVSCKFPDIAIPPFDRITISSRSIFADNSYSNTTHFATNFSPSPYLTPAKYYEIYNVPENIRGTNSKNIQSVTAFELQYINTTYDLATYFQYMGMPYQSPIIHGQNDESNPGGESTLDIEYIMGIGAGVQTIFWSVTGKGPAIPPGVNCNLPRISYGFGSPTKH